MMSSERKSIVEKDAVVEENISSADDNDDSSASAENFEAVGHLEDTGESKKLLGSASDADVSNFSSSDSTLTVTEADVDQKLGIGSKLQRSPKYNFERMKFEEGCQVKLHDDVDESIHEKETKLLLVKDKKSRSKPKCADIEVTDSTAGCSSEQGQILETASKRTIPDIEEQVDCRYSSGESVTISALDIKSSGSNLAEKLIENAMKIIISKKSPEKFMKTRLGSSEIAADVIEDAIDHTDDSVFANIGSTDFITSSIPSTRTVTDITEDAVDNTDQAVFTKISFDPVVTTVRDEGKVTDVTEYSTDQADGANSEPVEYSSLLTTSVSNIVHKKINSLISHEDTEQATQVQSDYRTLDLQEVKPGKVFSGTVSTIFGQVSQIEGEDGSDITTDTYNLSNIDIEKTESSIDSNPSDDRMEFSSASTIASVIGYHTCIEKMECSNDTYSGFESFKIDDESNTTLEKMECKSESSTSRDKMETESLSMKSNETEGMEYSSDSMSSFEKSISKSISNHEYEITSVQSESTTVQENEFISLQESQYVIVEQNSSISVHGNESTSVQEIPSISFHVDESIKVHESIGVPENESIGDRRSENIGDQQNKSIIVQENKSKSAKSNESKRVQENESVIVKKNESISVHKNEFISNQQTESINFQEKNSTNNLQQEDASSKVLESVSCLIGDFISRTIQETAIQQPHMSLSSLLDEPTVIREMSDSKHAISNESDTSSNEIKAIYESSTDPDKGIERKFAIPRKEASDTEEYDYEQKPVCDKKADVKKPSSRNESSLKRRNSTEDENVGKATEDQTQAPSSISEIPDAGNDELKDSNDKKGHKKLKK